MIKSKLVFSLQALGSALSFVFLIACSTPSHKSVPGTARSVASTDAPRCAGVGTRSEGWVSLGQPIVYDNCADKHIACAQDGWVGYVKKNAKMLKYASCAQSTELPKCIGIGTSSEGWSIPGEQIKYDNCANKGIACAGIGTRSEAWVVFEKVDPKLILEIDCATPK